VEVKVCDGELFNATCSSGAAVVVISTAFYRRTTERLCYTMESVVMCSFDVKPYVERQCAGRRRCQMPLGLEIDAWASKVKTCQSVIDGTRSFLHVIYSCLYGKHVCCRSSWLLYSALASVNLHSHHKVQKFSSGTGSPGWSPKKGRKMVVCMYVCVCC